MAKFVGLHTLQGMTEDRFYRSWKAYQDSCAQCGIKAISAGFSITRGMGQCLTEAASADQVRKAHQAANIPIDEVYEFEISTD